MQIGRGVSGQGGIGWKVPNTGQLTSGKDPAVDPDFDTFLTAVYTEIDTLLQTQLVLPPHPGHPPRMSDSEVLTLVVIGQWRDSSERAVLRWVESDLHDAFPVLLSQSAFNRRARRLGPVCTRLLFLLADLLDPEPAPYEVVDTIGVPLARCCRGKQHRCFGDEAGFGVGGSDHTFFYGCSLLLAVTPTGVITGFVVGPAGTQDRWLFDAFVGWRADPTQPLWTIEELAQADSRNRSRHLKGTGVTGPRWWPESVGHAQSGIYLTDNGFRGPVWHEHWLADDQAEVIASRDAASAALAHHRRRQIVETINAALTDVFHLAFPSAKTMWGVVCRIARKCLALNLGIWANRLFGRADLAFATLVSC